MWFLPPHFPYVLHNAPQDPPLSTTSPLFAPLFFKLFRPSPPSAQRSAQIGGKRSRNPQVRPRFAPIPIRAHRQTNHPDRLEPAVVLADTYVCGRSGDFDDFVFHFLDNERSIYRSCRFTFTGRTRSHFNNEKCKTLCSPRRQGSSCSFAPTSSHRTRNLGGRRRRRNFRSSHSQRGQDIPVE